MNKVSSTTHSIMQDALGAEITPAQLEALRTESREFTVASVFAAVMATLALWPGATHDGLVTWAVVVIAWTLLREGFMHFYAHKLGRAALPVALIVASAVPGLTWGVLPLAYFDPQSPLQAVFIAIVTIGLVTVSLVWLSAWKPAHAAFAIPALLALVWTLFSASYFVPGILTLAALAVVMYLAHKLERGVSYRAALQGRNTDLTAQLQSGSTEVRYARKAVERARGAKAEFLAAAGQGLRQRLYAANLLVDSLRNSDDPAEKRNAVDRLDEAIQGLDAAFESLQDMSQMQSAPLNSELESFHVRDIIAPLQTDCEVFAANEGLKFRTRVRDAVLRSDPRLLRRILRHLVHNALQHTTEGGVLLATRLRPAEVWIEVWDTGPGIAEGELHNLVKEFHKVERGDGARASGLGLGLTIVQHLCELLDHPLEVRSRVDRGSLFRVRVPRGSPRALRDSLFAGEIDPASLQGSTILILDGKRAMLAALEPVLRRWGCSVWPALSGEEALSLIQMEAVRPDAVICDSQLRGNESGFDVVAALRQSLGASLPVLMTAKDTHERGLRQRAARSRIVLLYKPVTTQHLCAALQRVLGAVPDIQPGVRPAATRKPASEPARPGAQSTRTSR